jgi:SAM-dependent methyltransferase
MKDTPLPFDYDLYARYYDILEIKPEHHERMNRTLEGILRSHGSKKVHDITCGTGSQLLYLSDKGYTLSGSDLSENMLERAKEKLWGKGISLVRGDMRSDRFGEFDAVISMFNSVGHLGVPDFLKALMNIKDNLLPGGIFVFDIMNTDYLRAGHTIDHEFIDTAKTVDSTKYVRFNQYSADLDRGLMRSRQRTYIQERNGPPELMEQEWELKIYSTSELDEMLVRCGYERVDLLSIDGGEYDPGKDLTILTVAQR